MGELVEYVNQVANMELDKVAKEIEADMKAVANEHWKSGEAYHAIHIEQNGEYSRIIGATGGEGAKHLYYLDQGNGGRQIYPKHSKALRLTDGRGNTVAFAGSVRPYKGIGFLKKIADKYNR